MEAGRLYEEIPGSQRREEEEGKGRRKETTTSSDWTRDLRGFADDWNRTEEKVERTGGKRMPAGLNPEWKVEKEQRQACPGKEGWAQSRMDKRNGWVGETQARGIWGFADTQLRWKSIDDVWTDGAREGEALDQRSSLFSLPISTLGLSLMHPCAGTPYCPSSKGPNTIHTLTILYSKVETEQTFPPPSLLFSFYNVNVRQVGCAARRCMRMGKKTKWGSGQYACDGVVGAGPWSKVRPGEIFSFSWMMMLPLNFA
ncbi:hypothetical protein CMEL01_09029 [Colletotrichum melonis]|uniref:Uncharacterized protein n=1 Tax=Colletotrichum melonis TaxID=1209925 RepID=A0AAI9TWE6_9PEZI|nr:hypothetical protein CMEL01_09029 [Colletotrichum melonis]